MQRFLTYIESRLGNIYSKNEMKSISHLLLKQLAGMNSVQIYTDKDTKFTDSMVNKLNTAVDRLANGEPIQYILGTTEFFGLKFKVMSGVLIPRPETEEMVELILKDRKNQQIQLLDIGTGSGCIAVSLAKNIPTAKVSAWDISEKAIQIARENADLNKVDIDFSLRNILEFEQFEEMSGKWDVIVSNPPYVCESERADMGTHILHHEPDLALFVKDNDPLIFYRHISLYAAKNLRKGGGLYFEINSHLGEKTLQIIEQNGFDAELFQDLSGRDRMIRAIL
ncbi:MAG: peptide chain release factor N(5)-glutamine methyltransferase [Bacteroidales bacterium]|nr:peptide chain release factor N(5)-glutamine methyltransferase [Bacteroidales bacterium]